MRIAHLTAGTGNFHCGNCHRDNTLVRSLRALGHNAFLVPLYLPLVLDEEAASPDTPLFAGGVNMFLQQKLGLFRHTPRWLDRLFDSTGLLKKVSAYAGMTRSRDLGEMTVETFRGLEGRQAKEWNRLLEWLETDPPDVVALSNGLLAGLAAGIKAAFPKTRIICSLQGEDSFLDSLPEPYRAEAWQALGQTQRYVDRFVGVSRYYAGLMGARMRIPPEKLAVVRNGVDLSGLSPADAPPGRPTLGYLARLCHGKGLHMLVDAFVMLKKRGNIPDLQLRIAGAATSSDDAYIAGQKATLEAAGVMADVEWLPNLEPEKKEDFLRSLSALSVPAHYGEAFGLFVIEALACGVPVVQPEHAAFPELIHATGGGVLVPPHDVPALAVAIEQLLLTPGLARRTGLQGRAAVESLFSAERMAREFAVICGAAQPGT